jgi:hypothetical protein
VATAVVVVTGDVPMRPDVWYRRNPPTKDASRIHITILAELRIVWSTRQNSFGLLENRRGKHEKLPDDKG